MDLNENKFKVNYLQANEIDLDLLKTQFQSMKMILILITILLMLRFFKIINLFSKISLKLMIQIII